MKAAAIRPWVTAAVAALVVAACTDDGAAPVGSPTTVAQQTSVAMATTTTAGEAEMDDAQFEVWLRRKLALPALPSFTIPLEAFVDQADREIADQLEVPPGLYAGIAVIDARCDAAGGSVAADGSGDLRGRDGSGEFSDGEMEIVVEGDGSGTYADASRTITIESDGSGSYVGGGVSLEIESDGSGRYDDGKRQIEVDSDRSGTYADGEIEVTVGSTGSSTYRDAMRTVAVSPSGEIEVDGNEAHDEVIARVLAEGLPLFPPVPHIGPIPEPVAGTSCGSVIRLDANVLFDFNADTLVPEAAALLDRVGALLVALGSPALRIDGHTDSVGTEEYNLDLSTRRAATVRRALADRGVSEGSMETRGLGESQPLAPNETATGADDPAARQLNRRVELVLLDP
jgi:OOP family OmpA-OmpF porin